MEIRLIAAGEEEICNAFHNQFHHQNRTVSQWRWEFASNSPSGAPIPYAVVNDGGKIVGTQAFIPIRMVDRRGIYWTAKSEETLVDPNYRGQGLFEKMYALLFKYAEEQNLTHIWGFSAAIKAFTRLGFTVPGVTQQLFIPFSTRSVAAVLAGEHGDDAEGGRSGMKTHALRMGGIAARMISAVRVGMTSRQVPAGLRIQTMDEPHPQCGDLCQRFIEQWGGTTIYRDADYMRWRLFENPYVRGIVRGIHDGDRLL
ncbi:MAG: GNAT family N-acetyltransferase, partial [candidate division Zixibacteria bacterium]|nr:GNAT family N-acetyltransferase [candidate division Zixibacteria bacterium]